MKHFLFCFALVCITSFNYAQQDSIANSLIIELPTVNFTKSNITGTVEIPLVSLPPITPSIMDTYWDHNVYNPYRNTLQQFPFEIKFNDTVYESPIKHKKVVTSRYGWRRGRAHNGIDIDLVTGDTVVTVLDGIVRLAKYVNGYGNTVVVRHYNGLESTYAHLSHIGVQPNDTLQKGQYLGKGGNTGNSRGSHLHLELSYNGASIYPEYLFDFSAKNTIRSQHVWVTQKWTHARFHNPRRVTEVKVIESAEDAQELMRLAKIPKYYVVKKGDTLYDISRKNNLSIAALCRSNAIKKNSTLKIGQRLVL
ncbi:M23 family metallopeptidase [Winogradskyella arenosi]|uniref:LysM domain-containing protein n=1 Tax=Winogradskyella arenosi TaxID=533325 RepID=A0A368ZCF1_9FLAO|nr:M23 family metallopeptidase [Winogradskyella arenosi]RCW90721.1 LysM domain-containing protein [Winogradskyella arenosi]